MIDKKSGFRVTKMIMTTDMTTTQIGQLAETLVLNWYLEQNYTLVAKNFNYYQGDKIGEIDLIMSKDKKLFLVEVKARKNQNFALALEQITRKKLMCLYKSYQGFLRRYPHYATWNVQMDAAILVDKKLNIYSNCYSFDSF
jgi:Holliday junction resolvase-like predicted endonuclease